MKTSKVSNTIQDNIADTLFIPLIMKKWETERENPFYSDPFACEIVNRIDYNFSKYRNAVRSSVGVAIRSKYFDEVTADFIRERTNPVFVNVGCGLDTLYLRLGPEIASNEVFYELDIPEAIDLREKLLPETENDIYLKNSMFETDWMDKLKGIHTNASFLFIAEGVMMYFEKKQVKSVFVDLAKRFSSSEILFDVTSSWMCKNSHRHDTVKYTNAPFKLALDDDREIERWARNLKFESARRYGDFKEWCRCGFFYYWSMKIIPALKNAGRMLCYRIE